MNLRLRLTITSFLEFFIFGAWIITFSPYAFKTLHFTGAQIGAVYGTIGIGSIFMPIIIGVIADKWFNAELVFAICHLLAATALFVAAQVTDPDTMFWIMLLYALAYAPTIPLANAICYRVLADNSYDAVKLYPLIRVWGTVGFILALWLVSILGFELSHQQLNIAGIAALALGLYAFTLPACPANNSSQNKSLVHMLGLDALALLKRPQISIFFIFSILVGAILQIDNIFISSFLHDFDSNPLYTTSFGVVYSGVIVSISKISEVLFILTVPFFLRRYGIKTIILISTTAWVLRFGLLAYGDPGNGLWMIILSMIIFGCAFDFFNISGSLFINMEAPSHMRASAQGLFFIMVLGIGGFGGAFFGGRVVDHFTTLINNVAVHNWSSVWLTFAIYAFIIGVLFTILFRYKHSQEKLYSDLILKSKMDDAKQNDTYIETEEAIKRLKAYSK